MNISIHPPPAFGSSPNLEALALEANDSDDQEEEGSVHANSQRSLFFPPFFLSEVFDSVTKLLRHVIYYERSIPFFHNFEKKGS